MPDPARGPGPGCLGYGRAMVAAAAERALTSYHWLGIPIAVAGAVLLSLGTLFQHRGVDDSAGTPGPVRGGGMGGGRLQRLVRRPAWLAGTGTIR